MFTKEEWKEYQVRLDVLTPIIINTGEYYDFGELIFSQEGKGKQINLSLLAKYLDKKNINCFVSEIEQRGLKYRDSCALKETTAIAKNHPEVIKKEVNFSINAKADFENSPNMQIAKIMEDKATGSPYIPGSSIKGALRTVILETIRNRKKQNGEIGDPDYFQMKKDFAKAYESLIYSNKSYFNVQDDPFKFIKVSDFKFERQSGGLFIGRASNQPTNIYSAMTDSFMMSRKQVIARGTISISSRLKTTGLNVINPYNFDDIRECSNYFCLKQLAAIKEKKYEKNGKLRIYNDIYDLLSKINDSKDGIIIKLGHYIGIENITFKLSQNKKYRTSMKNNNLEINKEGGKTFHLVDGRYPTGFCVLYIEEFS